MVKRKKISPEEHYKRWHWGIEAERDMHVPDPEYPEQMIEIGRLMQLDLVHNPKQSKHRINPNLKWVRNPSDGKLIKTLEIETDDVNDNYALFDHNHPKDRIYFVVDEETQSQFKNLYKKSKTPSMQLKKLSSMGGGHHSSMIDYPDVQVKPLGYIHNIIYITHKKGDEPILPYIHEFAEENRKNSEYPLLAVGENGRIWIAGGGYTCPYAGITD